MEKTEVLDILLLIENSYPVCRFRNETVELWFSQCHALVYTDVIQNICRHMRNRPYPPSFQEAAGISLAGKCTNWMEEYIFHTGS